LFYIFPFSKCMHDYLYIKYHLGQFSVCFLHTKPWKCGAILVTSILYFFYSVIEAGYMEGQQEINFITHLFIQNGLFMTTLKSMTLLHNEFITLHLLGKDLESMHQAV